MVADRHNENVAERRPLLEPAPNSSVDPEAPSHQQATTTTTRPLTIVALCFIVVSFLALSASFADPAFSELQEGILCRQYFGDVTDPAHDARCKTEEVQSGLSMLQAVEMTFGYTPSCLLSVAYGAAGEHLGRRPMLRFASFGLMLLYPVDVIIYWFSDIFDIRTIWPAAFVITSIGGGIQVLTAFIYTIISDVTTSTQRTNIFFYLTAVLVAAPLLGNPLSYFAMKGGPWLSSSLGALCNVLAFLTTLLIPETKHFGVVPSRIEADSGTNSEDGPKCTGHIVKRLCNGAITSTRDGARSVKTLLYTDERLIIVLFATLFTRIGTYVNALLMQYIAKRFSYSWSEANLALSIKWLCKLILVLLILPITGKRLLQVTGSPLRRDLITARYSVVLAVAGTLVIGLNIGPILFFTCLLPYSLIEGFITCTKALLAQIAGHDNMAVLFSVVSLLENLGLLLAGPFMAYTFRVGLQWGEEWFGLPFLVAGLLLSISGALIWGVRFGDEEVAQLDKGPTTAGC